MRRYSDMKLNKWQESKVSHRCGNMIHVTVWCMGLLPDTQYCGWRMRRECRERFPRHWFQRKQLVSDPDLHQGTCVTHVPWCMSGSLSRGGGEVGKTFPAFPAHAQPAILRIWQEAYWHQDDGAAVFTSTPASTLLTAILMKLGKYWSPLDHPVVYIYKPHSLPIIHSGSVNLMWESLTTNYCANTRYRPGDTGPCKIVFVHQKGAKAYTVCFT